MRAAPAAATACAEGRRAYARCREVPHVERRVAGHPAHQPSRRRTHRARQRWIGATARPRGHYVVDAGARRALESGNKSLLAIGVVDVVGDFDKGDVVGIRDASGQEFARGLTNYATADARRVRGLRTEQLRQVLGTAPYDEVIHRDNLVLTL